MKYKLAFIGYGVVGQGLTEILLEKQQMLKDKYDFEFSIVAISDIMKGSVYDQKGLDMDKILTLVKNGEKIDTYPTGEKGLNSNDSCSNTGEMLLK